MFNEQSGARKPTDRRSTDEEPLGNIDNFENYWAFGQPLAPQTLTLIIATPVATIDDENVGCAPAPSRM